ncbi:MAG: FtsX-like permease family protein [Bacteroidales bacterium]|nr:FtsX-like permease family protein [Bacteroidales bacterium]
MRSYLNFLSRNKLYTAIEALGLIVSLAFVLLTGHFVWQQRQMTRNVPDYKDVYTFYRSTHGSSGVGFSWGTALQAKEDIPEVEKAAMFWKGISEEESTIDIDGIKYHVQDCMVGGDFFEIFPAEFETGNATAMNDISNAIVSRSFANRLGGESAVIGKVIDGKYTIAAIIKETPNPIFGEPDVILNIENLTNSKNHPGKLDVIPFVKVRKGTDRAALEVKADSLAAKAFDAFGARNFLEDSGLVRYDELWYSPVNNQSLKRGSLFYTRIILLITIILLISAIFNYINLCVSMTGKRAKEMATRSLLGASKESLFRNRILESIVFTTVCFLLGILLAEALTPWFNRIIGGSVPVRVRYSSGWLLVYAIFILFVSFIQGSLPAWISARFPAISVVKGEFRAKNKHVFSKVFIVLQHVFSIILLALAIVMGLQVSHMVNRPLGAEVDNDFYFQINDLDLMDIFAEKASSLPCVSRIGHSTYFPGLVEEMITEDKEGKLLNLAVLNCDATAFDMFGFDIKEKFEEPAVGTVWISEKEMTRFGVDRSTEDLGHHHIMGRSIGGIIGDFAPNDVLRYDSGTGSYVRIGRPEEQYGLLIETTGDKKEARKSLYDLYRDLCIERHGIEDKPYMFDYIPSIISEQLSEVRDRLSLVKLFMLLSLLLSALGLVAMSGYYANENSHDIAVRKVFGSTVEGEVKKTVFEYLILMAIAAVVAVPVAVWLAGKLLEQYSYRISGYGWVFVVAVIAAALIALLAVLWQTLKAARTNPATELKKE